MEQLSYESRPEPTALSIDTSREGETTILVLRYRGGGTRSLSVFSGAWRPYPFGDCGLR